MSTENTEQKLYLVVDASKITGFITNDFQMACEIGKGSDAMSQFIDGTRCDDAIKYCEQYSWKEDCEMFGPISEDNINVSIPDDEYFGFIIPPKEFSELKYQVD